MVYLQKHMHRTRSKPIIKISNNNIIIIIMIIIIIVRTIAFECFQPAHLLSMQNAKICQISQVLVAWKCPGWKPSWISALKGWWRRQFTGETAISICQNSIKNNINMSSAFCSRKESQRKVTLRQKEWLRFRTLNLNLTWNQFIFCHGRN